MTDSQYPRTPPAASGRVLYTVSELNRDARALLEDRYGRIWVEGEIGDLSRPASGHLYFVLKDERAQIRCALFRGAQRLCCQAANGLHVRVHARVSLYEGRGEFQLIIDEMEEAGEGALRRAFEILKQRLAAEGLFAEERKRPVPRLIRRIALITSPDGAALHDILITLKRRFPAIAVLLYPVPVQGPDAAPRIAEALARAGTDRQCDVILLARGGGSLADLWPFNEESVARAIAAAALPVITGVGHEIDVTIADLVADRRAPTPTAAAELLSPDQAIWLARQQHAQERLMRLAERHLRERNLRLDDIRGRLFRALPHHLETLRNRWLRQSHRLASASPLHRLANSRLRLTELRHGLTALLIARLRHSRDRLRDADRVLVQHHPHARLATARLRQEALYGRLQRAVVELLQNRRTRLAQAHQGLLFMGPQQVLGRGYAIASAHGRVVRACTEVEPGDTLTLQLAEGSLEVVVVSRNAP